MKLRTLILLVLLFGLIGCAEDGDVPTVAPVASLNQTAVATESLVSNTPVAVPTATEVPPTPTPTIPLAAQVNGIPIFLADYEKELVRYEQAQAELGMPLPDNYRDVVLDALIERALIAHAAAEAGIVITDEMVDAQMAQLEEAAGGAENFAAWLTNFQYSAEEFREEVRAGMVTQQMVTAVTADVPTAVEQIRARYIQVTDAALANELLTRARAGDDFAFLAQQYSLDRLTGENGGDLGFFAAGSLLVPELENAAFGLANPGDIAEVVAVTQSDGSVIYYLVQLTEREMQRPLPAEQLNASMQAAFTAWLAEQWQNGDIQRFAAPGS
jgi:parvulin-like peptidyl-prolyl isomerase